MVLHLNQDTVFLFLMDFDMYNTTLHIVAIYTYIHVQCPSPEVISTSSVTSTAGSTHQTRLPDTVGTCTCIQEQVPGRYSRCMYSQQAYTTQGYQGYKYSQQVYTTQCYQGYMYSQQAYTTQHYQGYMYSQQVYTTQHYQGYMYSQQVYTTQCYQGYMYSQQAYPDIIRRHVWSTGTHHTRLPVHSSTNCTKILAPCVN
jgi:hypothetical protein